MSALLTLNLSRNAGYDYDNLLSKLDQEYKISSDLQSSLERYRNLIDLAVSLIVSSDEEDRYSKPMPWIGMYIALACLVCIFLMLADLLHGFRNRKLWFPCKYFTLNAASLTVIAVAMKLPVDLNNSMPGNVDQGAKLGSMAFMIVIMVNLLPSLATMDSKQLLTNIIALDILVITLVVNVCIQLKTGVISSGYSSFEKYYGLHYQRGVLAIIFASMMLVMLIIHISTALTILKSKQILESKYQAGHKIALIELQQPRGLLTVEKLKWHVRNHWIMEGTGNPQFITACSATTSASGVICVLCTILHFTFNSDCQILVYNSDYKSSMLVILWIQFLGVVLGTVAPLCRCFASLNFKLSIKLIWNHIKVFRVESYWTQKLCDWKQSSIPFSITGRNSKILFQFFKILILNSCIGFQITVVVACKMIGLIPMFLVIGALLCIRCLKWLKVMITDSGAIIDDAPGQHDSSSRYVLQHQDDMEVAERTLKQISNSMRHLIWKAKKQQPNNLMTLLAESSCFEGVGKYDSHHVPPLFGDEYLDCWSLPLVTLTTIIVSLPNIQNSIVDRLLSSVSEGLAYVTVVEETLNATNEYKSIQNAAKKLWLEVEVNHKWLGKKVKKLSPQVNTSEKILEWFKDTAKNIVYEVKQMAIGSGNDKSIYMSICANSMYRITETIILSYNTNIEQVSQEELFYKLSSMIADIMAACLTNLPQVIAIKCHENEIEKREASIHIAVKLLGETMQIINSLQDQQLPSLNPDELPFIHKWRATLMHPSP